MKGTRKHVGADGNLSLKPGEFGIGRDGVWYACCARHMTANLSNHTVIEHEDGMITVSPSILLTQGEGGRDWHGYIENGVFRTV
jgi:hypothetical protein